MSITGVPSIASSASHEQPRPLDLPILARCNPSGLGRSGERVAKTPVSGRFGRFRGRTCVTLRSAWWNHVIRITSSPAAMRCSAGASSAASSTHASGAPLVPPGAAPFAVGRRRADVPDGPELEVLASSAHRAPPFRRRRLRPCSARATKYNGAKMLAMFRASQSGRKMSVTDPLSAPRSSASPVNRPRKQFPRRWRTPHRQAPLPLPPSYRSRRVRPCTRARGLRSAGSKTPWSALPSRPGIAGGATR